MSKHLISHLFQSVLTLWAAFTIAFVLLQALPGDAVLIKFLASDFGLTPEQITELQQTYGVNLPLWQKYFHELGAIFTGNLGFSVQAGLPVSQVIATNLPPTLLLASLGFTAAIVLALSVAFLSAFTCFSWLRQALHALPSLFVSVPVFWLGIVLIQIVSFQLGLIPVINPGHWEGLILPTIALAIPISAPIAQILIRNIEATLLLPHVAVARAKGASHVWVLWHHVARNAVLPTLTMAGLLFGELLAGAVVTETVFGLSGLGSLTQQAVNNQDTAVLKAIVIISAAIFITINLIVDLLYPILDPRLRVAQEARP
ncbi:ABC transporter permease [Microvirga sp. W0021]|uniref:ABC transporter permease n=1 Tax=Hohaiivirga grylli TaxID=3133970 RepID=A0ABV0BHA5_9HYPH